MSRRVPSRFFAALALASGLAALCGCGGSSSTATAPGAAPDSGGVPLDGASAGPPERGDCVRLVDTADPQSLNFIRATDRFSSQIAGLVTDTLVQYDAKGEVIGRVAESWSVSDDGLTWTFRIRPGVRWQDGAPVTSRDAAYTLERILDPRSRAVSRIGYFTGVVSVETPDDATFRVHYREPSVTALASWTDAPLIPRHLWEKQADFLDNPLCRAPVGCGPFRFVSWDAGRQIVLEANDGYWDGRPALDRIVFRIIPQDTTRLQALELGEVDALSLTPDQVATRADRPEFTRRFRRLTYPLPYVYYIGWNMDRSNPFFSDRRVRQAMTLALDRPGLLRDAWHGLGIAAASYITRESWAYNPALRPIPYDPAGAAALLDAAGWTDSDGDGVREKGGVPFAFTLLYAATGKMNDDTAAYFQENLRKVGVRMDLSRTEFRTMLDLVGSHRFAAFMSGLTLDADPDAFDMFHSSQARDGNNRVSYSNPEMDRLSEQGRREFDPARRRAVYARIQEILAEDQPWTFVSHPLMNVAIDRRIRGVTVSPLGLQQFWPGIAGWWVPRAEQRFPAGAAPGA